MQLALFANQRNEAIAKNHQFNVEDKEKTESIKK
jgi:hypothetical protein